MSNPILEIPIELFSGTFSDTVKFTNNLNIIAGENGTGKTELLKQLRELGGRDFYAVSPKRNSENAAVQNVMTKIKQQQKTRRTYLDEAKAFSIKDDTFDPYPSFPELFVTQYQEHNESGKITMEEAVKRVKNEFNRVLNIVFPNYKIVADWQNNSLELAMKKNNNVTYPIDKLSCGEREVFSLMFNVYINTEADVYLIDEPEVHLNWSLERGLFSFLDWYSKKYDKQFIVTTHSRVVFDSEYYSKTQFMMWSGRKIIMASDPPHSQVQSIAGDMAKIMAVTNFEKTTLFVEDEAHKEIADNLFALLGRDVDVMPCGDKQAVLNLTKLAAHVGAGWDKAYFMVDGDNQGAPKGYPKLIYLEKYCIENYLFNYKVLSALFIQSDDDVIREISECINNIPKNKHNRVFTILTTGRSIPKEALDAFDCSNIIGAYCALKDHRRESFIKDYMKKAIEMGMGETIFKEILAVVPA